MACSTEIYECVICGRPYCYNCTEASRAEEFCSVECEKIAVENQRINESDELLEDEKSERKTQNEDCKTDSGKF